MCMAHLGVNLHNTRFFSSKTYGALSATGDDNSMARRDKQKTAGRGHRRRHEKKKEYQGHGLAANLGATRMTKNM